MGGWIYMRKNVTVIHLAPEYFLHHHEETERIFKAYKLFCIILYNIFSVTVNRLNVTKNQKPDTGCTLFCCAIGVTSIMVAKL